ncbi:hypothetical protein BVH42_04560 [Campylobacter lari]|nr:hypothetical protein [Campylobacter lari]
MKKLLEHCKYLDQILQVKQECQLKDNINYNDPCTECLQNTFYLDIEGLAKYDCVKKLARYVLTYGPLYVSEIYSFLKEAEIIEKINKDIINILSLGSGFGPDNIAIEKYMKETKSKKISNYIGLDIEKNWRYITQNNSSPIIYDILKKKNLQGYDILFLNKIVSSIVKNKQYDELKLSIQKILDDLPYDAYVVFNDINLEKLKRDDFHNFLTNTYGLKQLDQFYFDGYCSTGFKKLELDKEFLDNLKQDYPCKDNINKTIIFLYQKKRIV